MKKEVKSCCSQPKANSVPLHVFVQQTRKELSK